jgi:ADP-ribose pyrophosphatase YjhB (NUDIX family)
MPNIKKFVVRCRGIILYNNKLLVVRHPSDVSYAALPGGHLEWGEDIKDCLRREIIEELGVEPKIGRLLYVNSFVNQEDVHSVEFFFEVTNGIDYEECEKRARTHAHELAEISWASPADNVQIRPEQLARDFKEGSILSTAVRYIS